MGRPRRSPTIRFCSCARTTALVLVCLAVVTTFAQTADVGHAAFVKHLVAAAIERTHHYVRYDGAYVRIPYPGGDVPAETGVCTDVIIRTYRAVGVDLQREVHEDMVRDFGVYPHLWHESGPDTNIDHRRVPNLMVFFRRNGETLPISANASDYSPGDLVT